MKALNNNLKPKSIWLAIARWRWFGWLGLGLAGVGLVTFLSLRSSPAISTVGWMPRGIAHWADRHGRFCNFPAYGLVAVPFLMIASTFRRQAWVVALLALLIALLETAQLELPARSCDFWDMGYGWAGLLAAWMLCAMIKKFTTSRLATPASPL